MCIQHKNCSHVSELLSRKSPGSLYVVIYHHKNQVFFACNGHIFVFRDVKEFEMLVIATKLSPEKPSFTFIFTLNELAVFRISFKRNFFKEFNVISIF